MFLLQGLKHFVVERSLALVFAAWTLLLCEKRDVWTPDDELHWLFYARYG